MWRISINIIVGMMALSLTQIASAQESRLYERIDRLEAENARLIEEVIRLRSEAARLRQQRYAPSRYGYQQRPLNEATRNMNDLYRARQAWERVVR